ncbi:MAG: PucC family protein, partial [Wenzhouxiangellaceae bacterium]
ATMQSAPKSQAGLALGAWGAVQATAAGIGIGLGGLIRDFVHGLATQGSLGEALTGPATAYGFVYHLEILLLFVTLAVVGPLARPWKSDRTVARTRFGLDQMPG